MNQITVTVVPPMSQSSSALTLPVFANLQNYRLGPAAHLQSVLFCFLLILYSGSFSSFYIYCAIIPRYVHSWEQGKNNRHDCTVLMLYWTCISCILYLDECTLRPPCLRPLFFLTSLVVFFSFSLDDCVRILYFYTAPKNLENVVEIFLESIVRLPTVFRNQSLILLKYCANLAMSAQNMTYAIFSKYC